MNLRFTGAICLLLAIQVTSDAPSDNSCPLWLEDPGKIYGYLFGKLHKNYQALETGQTLACLRALSQYTGGQRDVHKQVQELIGISELISGDDCWQTDYFETIERLILFHEIKQHTLNIIPYLYHYEEAQFKLSNDAATRAVSMRLASVPEDREQRLRRFMRLLAESERPSPEWPYFRSNWASTVNGTYYYAKEFINELEDRRLKLETYATALERTIGSDCGQINELFAKMFKHFKPLLSGSRKILKKFDPSLVEWLKISAVCGHLINSRDLIIKDTYEIIMANIHDNNILSKFLNKFIRL